MDIPALLVSYHATPGKVGPSSQNPPLKSFSNGTGAFDIESKSSNWLLSFFSSRRTWDVVFLIQSFQVHPLTFLTLWVWVGVGVGAAARIQVCHILYCRHSDSCFKNVIYQHYRETSITWWKGPTVHTERTAGPSVLLYDTVYRMRYVVI